MLRVRFVVAVFIIFVTSLEKLRVSAVATLEQLLKNLAHSLKIRKFKLVYVKSLGPLVPGDFLIPMHSFHLVKIGLVFLKIVHAKVKVNHFGYLRLKITRRGHIVKEFLNI